MVNGQNELWKPKLASWIKLELRNAWVKNAWIRRDCLAEETAVEIKVKVRFTARDASLRNNLDLEKLKQFCVNRLKVENAKGKYEILDLNERPIFATPAYKCYKCEDD